VNSETPFELEEARTALLAQKPFLAQYGGAAVYMPNLTNGSWDVSHGYNGDIVTAAEIAAEENLELVYLVPAEGGILWVDNMVIPRGARNIEAAHEFIDFILEPEHQIRNSLSAGYASPGKVATDYLPPDFKADPAVYPPTDILARLEIVGSLSPTANALYDDIWTDVQG
jgi:spermidine/putrescine-binding protein